MQKLLDISEAAISLHDGAVLQLHRVEQTILEGMNPGSEKPHLVYKGSDIVRFELRSVYNADQEISARLGRLEELFALLLTSQRKTVTMLNSSESASVPSNPTQAETDNVA